MGFKFECPNCGDEKIAKFLRIGDGLICTICSFDFIVPKDAIYAEGDSSILSQMKDDPDNTP